MRYANAAGTVSGVWRHGRRVEPRAGGGCDEGGADGGVSGERDMWVEGPRWERRRAIRC